MAEKIPKALTASGIAEDPYAQIMLKSDHIKTLATITAKVIYANQSLSWKRCCETTMRIRKKVISDHSFTKVAPTAEQSIPIILDKTIRRPYKIPKSTKTQSFPHM